MRLLATLVTALLALTFLTGPDAARADAAWVQVEARPTKAEAEARAESYAGTFGNVQGYRLASGWYAIVIGPFAPEEAARQLDLLRGEKIVPADSFLATGSQFGPQFWPGATGTQAEPAPAAGANATPLAPALSQPDESIETALAEEQALSREARQDLQSALNFASVYSGKVDGSFGKGTRASIASWQAAQGAQATGILTARQRGALLAPWAAERDLLAMTPVNEIEAGIAVDLPMGLVAFDRYDPPFVRYKAKGGSGVDILLISAEGDGDTLSRLFDRVGAPGAMPPGGARTKDARFFSIAAADATRQAFAEAERRGSLIKGFVIVGPASQGARLKRILSTMEASFTPVQNAVLDENLGTPSNVSAADLTSGLSIEPASATQSGVFVDAAGMVLTSAAGLAGCGRLVIDGQHDASVAWQDPASGIALLQPATPLAPRGYAAVAGAVPTEGAVVVTGSYPYGDRLSAPVVSFGRLAEAKGLHGETDRLRLSLRTESGDAGAAVLDATGAMIGLVIAVPKDPALSLPPDVSFARPAALLSAKLQAAGHPLSIAAVTPALAPEDLGAKARAMTALVSCWK